MLLLVVLPQLICLQGLRSNSSLLIPLKETRLISEYTQVSVQESVDTGLTGTAAALWAVLLEELSREPRLAVAWLLLEELPV